MKKACFNKNNKRACSPKLFRGNRIYGYVVNPFFDGYVLTYLKEGSAVDNKSNFYPFEEDTEIFFNKDKDCWEFAK